VNPLTNTRLLLSFKLKCEFLDHVTPDFSSPEHLPHSIFDDCSNEIDKILEIMEERKQNDSFLWGYSPYINEDGSMTDYKVNILEYDFDRGEFLIEFQEKYRERDLRSYDYLQHKDLSRISKLTKYCCRSNIQMEYESHQEALFRKDMVARRRHEAQNQLNCEKAFINELAHKYDYVKMDRFMKENIKKKLLFNLNNFDPKSYVNNLCIQVETLYIFSILKSLLYSQFHDSNIQKIVSRYRIREISPPPTPFYALKSYELRGSPVEKSLSKKDACAFLNDYSLIGRQCYIDAIFKIKDLNHFMIEGQLFCHPLNYEIMYQVLKNDPDYKNRTYEQIGKHKFALLELSLFFNP